MNAECAICFEPLQSSNHFSSTPCGHVFHHQCLMEWLSSELQSKTEDEKIMLERLKIREDKIRQLEESAQSNKEAHEVEIKTQREQDKLIKELTARYSALETLKSKLEVDLQKRENEMEIHKEKEKLIEVLTARCSGLKKSKRKLKSALETLGNKLTMLQNANAVKEEPLLPTEFVPEERGEEIATVHEETVVKEEFVPLTEVKSKKREKKFGSVQEATAVKEEAGSSTKLASGEKRTPRKVLSRIDSNSDTQAARRKRGLFKRLQ